MNNFEKAVIGVARADQAAKRVENTFAMIQFAIFGVIVLAAGVFVYSIKKQSDKRMKLAIELAGIYGVEQTPDLYQVLKNQNLQVLESLKKNPENTGNINIPTAIRNKYAGQTIFKNINL